MNAYRRAAAAALLTVALGALGACSSQDADQGNSTGGDDPLRAAAPSPTESATPTPQSEPGRNPQADPLPEPATEEPAAASPAPAPSQAAARATTNACRSSQLTGVEADRLLGDSATKVLFVFRTAAPAGCTLQGYPSITLLDAAGAPVPVAVRHGGLGLVTTSPKPHELRPDGSLSFFLAMPPPSGGNCSSAATVRVGLPSNGGSVDVSSDISVCTGSVSVTPFQALGQAGQIGN